MQLKPSAAPSRAGTGRAKAILRDDRRAAFWFLLPSFLGLAVFLLLPLAASLALSFTNWQLIGQSKFVGWRNYVNLLTIDPSFWQILRNTFHFTIEYLVLNIVISLTMAVWISNLRWGKRFFRLIFFLPTFTPLIGSAIVWLLIFTPGGFADWFFSALHLPIPNLLTSPDLAIQAIVIVSLWSGFGYNLLLFGAALEAIPSTYLDAAAIDGASSWQIFRHVIWPLLLPTVLVVTILNVAAGFTAFDLLWVMASDYPGKRTLSLAVYMYYETFSKSGWAYGSAIAVVLSSMVIVVTWALATLQSRVQDRIR